MQNESPNILGKTTSEIVAAYVTHNHVAAAEMPALIDLVYASLRAIAANRDPAVEPAFERPSAAQIRKSITQDGLISFIDGKPYQTLKRHLGKHGLDPYSNRERYGLPADYPVTAPSYSQKRSALAKSFHFGHKTVQPEARKTPKVAPRRRKSVS